jgi:hypothetical protein
MYIKDLENNRWIIKLKEFGQVVCDSINSALDYNFRDLKLHKVKFVSDIVCFPYEDHVKLRFFIIVEYPNTRQILFKQEHDIHYTTNETTDKQLENFCNYTTKEIINMLAFGIGEIRPLEIAKGNSIIRFVGDARGKTYNEIYHAKTEV